MEIVSGAVKCKDIGNGKRMLTENHWFSIDGVDYIIESGFIWDGASIPMLLRWHYGTPFDAVHLKGGLHHDAFYGGMVHRMSDWNIAEVKRKKADEIYCNEIRANGSPWIHSIKEWLAVRIFGATHWVARAVAVIACCMAVGCKSISFERIEGEKIVRGSYYAYGIENNLEGLEIQANPTNGVIVRINRSTMDMSEKHEKIVEASGKTAGTIIGAAAAAAIK